MNRTEEMIALNKQGYTLQAIGDRYGLTRERVRQILVQSKIKVTEVRSTRAKTQKEAFTESVCEWMRKGLTKRAIARKLDVPVSQIYQMKLPAEAYFHKDITSLLDRMDRTDEHWIWTGAFNPVSGCPTASRRRISKSNRVQVIIYTAIHGKPKGDVRVKCGIKKCCNPDHLIEIKRRKSILKKKLGKENK